MKPLFILLIKLHCLSSLLGQLKLSYISSRLLSSILLNKFWLYNIKELSSSFSYITNVFIKKIFKIFWLKNRHTVLFFTSLDIFLVSCYNWTKKQNINVLSIMDYLSLCFLVTPIVTPNKHNLNKTIINQTVTTLIQMRLSHQI